MKICNKCLKEKDFSQFSLRKDIYKNIIKFSLRNNCRVCESENKKNYYQKNYNYIKLKNINYQLNNKDKIRNTKKEYNKKHGKQQYQKNKIKKAKYKKEYSAKPENKKRLNKKRRDKYNNDPNYKLRQNISNIIRGHLFLNDFSKNGESCLKYLDYTIDKLRLHIESLFEPWMNWNNHGIYDPLTFDINPTWQIDHIVPHSFFKYPSMDNQSFKECWALSNLRPLSAKQNILDGNRR